jgi:V/A-type H+-transporting ATPase subunit I
MKQTYEEIEENRVEEKLIYLDKILSEEREISNYLKFVKKNTSGILSLYNELLTMENYLKIMNKARRSEYFLFLEGYTRSKSIDRLIKIFNEKYPKKIIVEREKPNKYEMKEDPPTAFSLPKVLKPFETIAGIYGTPSYWEINPTILFAFTFPLFFALMFPDAGDGLIVLIFSIFLYRYSVRKNSYQLIQISEVLGISSFLSIIIGMFIREFFGPLLIEGTKEILPNVSQATVGPLYYIWPISPKIALELSPIIPFGNYSEPVFGLIDTMIIAILIGALTMLLSNILGMYNTIHKVGVKASLFENLPILIIYSSIILLFLYGFINPKNYFKETISVLSSLLDVVLKFPNSPLESLQNFISFTVIMLIIFGLLYSGYSHYHILTRTKRKRSSLSEAFIEGVFEPLLLLVSNTISFIRLLVLGMAHYFILYAFSYFAFMSANTLNTSKILMNPVSLTVLILGNLLAIGLEGSMAFIQSLRLNLYELGGKFCLCNGRPFMPSISYVKVILN